MSTANIKTSRFSFLWLLPIIALATGIYLTYQKYDQLGPVINIQFSSANGIQAGKTIISYKDLEIGKITDITLSDDMNSVIVTAQMTKTAQKLLHQDTQFWVVKPQITTTGIDGLSTLVSGNYIAIDPGLKAGSKNSYLGLSQAPLINSTENGIKLHLNSESSFGLHDGSPVFYKGFKVGNVEQIIFDEKSDDIKVNIFINAPYDKLISNNTKFYNVSGFNFDLGPNGADFQLQSLETVLIGGISFTTPASLNPNKEVLDTTQQFTLYGSLDSVNQPRQIEKVYYVLYLDNTSGLSKDSLVTLNGFEIGRVVDLKLVFDSKARKIVSSVLIYIQPSMIQVAESKNGNIHSLEAKDISTLVDHGLRATLTTNNFISGKKVITLQFYKDGTNEKLLDDLYSDYQVFPTHDNELTTLATNLSGIMGKIDNIPLDTIASNMNIFISNLNKTTENLNNTLQGVDQNSSLYFMLNNTLEKAQKTMQSIDKLSNTIDKKPNSIIFGK